LDEFEGRPAGDEQGAADGLVDGVVAADVLAGDQQVAGVSKQGGGVQAAGAVEDPLCGAQRVGQRGQGGRWDPQRVGRRREAGARAYRVEGSLAADVLGPLASESQ
jgi:hypothetical protein